MNKIAIIGAGGHTRSALNILKSNYKDYIFEIYDDSYVGDRNELICKVKVVGKIKNIAPDNKVFLSIGDNGIRQKFFAKYKDNLITDNLLHKSAIVEENVSLGQANQILAKVYINSGAKIGDNNIINTGAIIEHEAQIGSHNHISVGTKVCGRATIGNHCMIGAGAIIIDKISVCNNVIIGAGAVVVNNISESGTYIGIPAKRIK